MPSLRFWQMYECASALRLQGREGLLQDERMTPMKAQTQSMARKVSAAEALILLEQAWTYYMPEPKSPAQEAQPDLFQYANAA